MHFKIPKMIDTCGFLTALECTKFVFGRGSLWGSLQPCPRAPSWFKRALLLRGGNGRERKEIGEWSVWEAQGKGGGKGDGEKVKTPLQPFLAIPLIKSMITSMARQTQFLCRQTHTHAHTHTHTHGRTGPKPICCLAGKHSKHCLILCA